MLETPKTSDDIWADAKVNWLIRVCAERAALVLDWADEILDEWI